MIINPNGRASPSFRPAGKIERIMRKQFTSYLDKKERKEYRIMSNYIMHTAAMQSDLWQFMPSLCRSYSNVTSNILCKWSNSRLKNRHPNLSVRRLEWCQMQTILSMNARDYNK